VDKNFERSSREDPGSYTLQLLIPNDANYLVPLSRMATVANQPLIYYPKLWNEFIGPCKSTSSELIFKKELQIFRYR
jgi:hypothetical protein